MAVFPAVKRAIEKYNKINAEHPHGYTNYAYVETTNKEEDPLAFVYDFTFEERTSGNVDQLFTCTVENEIPNTDYNIPVSFFLQMRDVIDDIRSACVMYKRTFDTETEKLFYHNKGWAGEAHMHYIYDGRIFKFILPYDVKGNLVDNGERTEIFIMQQILKAADYPDNWKEKLKIDKRLYERDDLVSFLLDVTKKS